MRFSKCPFWCSIMENSAFILHLHRSTTIYKCFKNRTQTGLGQSILRGKIKVRQKKKRFSLKLACFLSLRWALSSTLRLLCHDLLWASHPRWYAPLTLTYWGRPFAVCRGEGNWWGEGGRYNDSITSGFENHVLQLISSHSLLSNTFLVIASFFFQFSFHLLVCWSFHWQWQDGSTLILTTFSILIPPFSQFPSLHFLALILLLISAEC